MARRRLRRSLTTASATVAALALGAGPALACGFLVAENGAIRLDTFTAVASLDADGDANYVTSFSFGGAPEDFGAIIPLPAVPETVEKAPGWFLQRLVRETESVGEVTVEGGDDSADGGADAMVIETYEVDSLDITILAGGGEEVLSWALANGYDLGVGDGDADDLSDAVAMLDFYGDRSPVFAAIRFDNERAAEQDIRSGEGTPVRFAFTDQDEAWIPVRVLGFDKPASERVQADLFLMTEDAPAILGGRVDGTEVTFQRSYGPNDLLVADLRSDERAEWVPDRFTLTRIDVDTRVDELGFDIAATPSGAVPELASAFGADWSAGEPVGADVAFMPGRLDDTGTDMTLLAVAGAALLTGGWLVGRRRTAVGTS